MNRLGYRPDIDGLRAIAVLAVILYHMGFGLFSGGFVGVDVFFVISGYLITKNIIDRRLAGTFTFSSFFVKRFRRLFPALFATTAVTFAFAYYLLPPPDMERFAGSVISSIFSWSNIYFWYQSGYFETSAITKPLLHTWSLSVEEQFYFIWPLLTLGLLALGRHMAIGLLCLLFATSLYGAQYYAALEQSIAFFWMPFRVFEFICGGVIAWLGVAAKSRTAKEFSTLLGLSLIAYSVLTFDESTVFPGVNALVPCVGAALVIVGAEESHIGMILRNRLCVYVGLISYSLYLVHWPIISLFSFRAFAEKSVQVQVQQMIFMFASAVAMYILIERPMRFGSFTGGTKRAFAIASAACVIAIPSMAYSAWSNDGWEFRVNESVAKMYDYIGWGRNNPGMERGECFIWKEFDFDKYNREKCLSIEEGRKNVLVLGDSHAADLIYGMRLAYPDFNFLHASSHSCKPWNGYSVESGEVCSQMNDFFFKEYDYEGVDAVILSAQHMLYSDNALEKTLASSRHIEQQGAKPIIIGPAPSFRIELPNIINSLRLADSEGMRGKASSFIEVKVFDVDKKAMQFFEKEGVSYISLLSSICSGRECEIFDENGVPLIFDKTHFTNEGSFFVAERMGLKSAM